MKKLFAWVLLAAMLVAAVACGEKTPADKPSYQFTAKGVTVSIDVSAEEILRELGSWLQYDESPSCAFEGLDKIYVYAGFRIQTYPMNGKDYVYSVELIDDSVATDKGIVIGSDRASVLKAYGETYDTVGSSISYAGNGSYLQFFFRDGAVSSILYLKENPAS